MNKLKVSIVTEGGNKLGLGHIYSCLSFYQAFKLEKVEVQMLINGNSSIKELMKGVKFELVDWLKKKNEDYFFERIKDSTILIIDSLFATKKFCDKISSKIQVPVFMDYGNRLDYRRGIVINRTLDAHKLNYSRNKSIVYLLGTRYFPLTKAFWYVPEKKINKEVKSVLITFGGSDSKEMTPKILKLLGEKFKDLNKYVIIGKAFENVSTIKKYLDKNTKLFYHPDGETIKKIMLESDIAISAGGQTLFELARIGVPTIAVTVADNQKYNIASLKDIGFIEYSGSWNDKDFYSNLQNSINNLKSFNLREKKNIIGRNLIDGYGSVRVVNFVLGFSRSL